MSLAHFRTCDASGTTHLPSPFGIDWLARRILRAVKRPKIFISHASEDRSFVEQLVARLKLDGVDTWLDTVEIRVGDSIYERINAGLEQSDFFAVVLSNASAASEWVLNELASATSLEKLRKRKVFVLPILLNECDVPPLLRDRRVANFKEDFDSAYQELIDAIRHHYAEHHPDVDISKLKMGELSEAVVEDAARDPRHLQRLAPRHFEELVSKLLSRAGYQTELNSVLLRSVAGHHCHTRSPAAGTGLRPLSRDMQFLYTTDSPGRNRIARSA